MRLINTKTLRLEEFYAALPEYAILSHRWESEEVTLQDITNGRYQHLKGWVKTAACCRLANSRDVPYAWVDTCCIDKTNSAELTESINSMYFWYENAKECYAYLSDVHCSKVLSDRGMEEFTNSVWFRRGWTLQELIAPKRVLFYNNDWTRLGCRASLEHEIARATLIDPKVLQGKVHPHSCAVAQRLSWAAQRETTRIEDRAYSLLGLLGVNMPLLYGEREKAFQRLQEEFIKISDDHTIFAWSNDQISKSILAPSPNCFKECYELQRMNPTNDTTDGFSMHNIGLKIQLQLLPWAMNIYLAPLRCVFLSFGREKNPKTKRYFRICLLLQRTEHDSQYVRVAIDGADIILRDPEALARMSSVLKSGRQSVMIRRNNTSVEPMFYGYKFSFGHKRMFSRGPIPEPTDVLCVHEWKRSDPVFEVASGGSRLAGVFRLSGFSSNLYMFFGFDAEFQPLCLLTSNSPQGLLGRVSNFDRITKSEAVKFMDAQWLDSKLDSSNSDGAMIRFRGDRQTGATIECKALQMRITMKPRYSTYLHQRAWCVDFEDLVMNSGRVTPVRFGVTTPVNAQQSREASDTDTIFRFNPRHAYTADDGQAVERCTRPARPEVDSETDTTYRLDPRDAYTADDGRRVAQCSRRLGDL